MAKFVNLGDDVEHYFPAGHGDSLPVLAGQLVDVGDANVEEQDDCYVVGTGDAARAWPKSRWELQKTKSTPTKEKSAPASQDKTDSPAE